MFLSFSFMGEVQTFPVHDWNGGFDSLSVQRGMTVVLTHKHIHTQASYTETHTHRHRHHLNCYTILLHFTLFHGWISRQVSNKPNAPWDISLWRQGLQTVTLLRVAVTGDTVMGEKPMGVICFSPDPRSPTSSMTVNTAICRHTAYLLEEGETCSHSLHFTLQHQWLTSNIVPVDRFSQSLSTSCQWRPKEHVNHPAIASERAYTGHFWNNSTLMQNKLKALDCWDAVILAGQDNGKGSTLQSIGLKPIIRRPTIRR